MTMNDVAAFLTVPAFVYLTLVGFMIRWLTLDWKEGI